MRRGLSFDHIFPIRDTASATLARTKADRLLEAGVIDTEDRLVVYGRTAVMLGYAEGSTPAWPLVRCDTQTSGAHRPVTAG